jgi:hypothetical protein
MSPRFHPLDQFRRDHPLLEEQGQDVGLEQAPQDDGIEDGGVDKNSVRPGFSAYTKSPYELG